MISDGCVDIPAVSFGIYGIILVVMLVRLYGPSRRPAGRWSSSKVSATSRSMDMCSA